jgi:hypothetical protein
MSLNDSNHRSTHSRSNHSRSNHSRCDILFDETSVSDCSSSSFEFGFEEESPSSPREQTISPPPPTRPGLKRFLSSKNVLSLGGQTQTSRPTLVRFQGSRNVKSLGDDLILDSSKLQLQTSIHQAMQCLTDQERDVRKSARVHLDKAKARFDCHNTKGAVISMRKFHKQHFEQTSMLAAFGQLRTLQIELEEQISQRGHDQVPGKKGSTCADLSEFTDLEQKVKKILRDGQREHQYNMPSDDELLSELNAFTNTRWTRRASM